MKAPSELGRAIEAAAASRFIRQSEPVQYLCTFRSPTGHVFAMERVIKSQITLWLPEDPRIRAAAEALDLTATRSEPFPGGRQSDYGRLSSLKSEPELRDSTLYRVAVSTVAQAIAILEAIP